MKEKVKTKYLLRPLTKKIILRLAALYNLVWGLAIILFPNFLFDWSGLTRLNYPEIWQCVGMIVGVYGVGYWIASESPDEHWPIVLVGLLGKIFGPIGFLKAISEGRFNWTFGATIVTNDLIWWVPFALLLVGAYQSKHSRSNSVQGVKS